jgi:histidinol phosphatase-like enzyme
MPFILAVDFDGTLCDDVFPEQGDFKEDILNKVKEFKKHGAEIILWTCREGKSLDEAVKRCKDEGLEFDAVNDNVSDQKDYMEEKKKEGEMLALRKIYADFYVDDKAMNLEIFLNISVESTCKNFADRE